MGHWHRFSLHRPGVARLGAHLKWSKPVGLCSEQAGDSNVKAASDLGQEEQVRELQVPSAVAQRSPERKPICKGVRGGRLRSKEHIVCIGLVRYKVNSAQRKLQRLPDAPALLKKRNSWCADSKLHALLASRKTAFRGAVYFRVGDGNQLVRVSRPPCRFPAVQKTRWNRSPAAVQKARWTLTSLRYHRRRKQYCQFFTRFGKCDSEEGKCPYIHDADKVAVCTQFLKGTCRDKDCRLTHRAIPERMPDCLYFLQGLCTNEECPYRHVKVNAKAPICDKFLRGYCEDGDDCSNRHTYVCPAYDETGHCPEQATCKLHHPKKKEAAAAAAPEQVGTRRKRRDLGCDSGNLKDGGESEVCEDRQLSRILKLFPPSQQAELEAFLVKVHERACDVDRLIQPSFILPREDGL